MVGGGVAVFVAVFAGAVLVLARWAPTSASPTARTSPVVASPSTSGQATPSPAGSPSPSPQESPSPSDSPSPSPSPPPQPLVFGDLTVHPGDLAFAYTPKQFSVSGGTAPYSWSLTSGTLPPGLNLATSGLLSGTPGQLGSYVFSIGVSDAGGAGSAATLAITISQLPSIAPICAQSCSVEAGCQEVCGTFGTLSGGSAPFQYAVIGGALPAGTTLSGLSLAGTFGPAGNPAPSFTVQLTDAAGAGASVAANFKVTPHITLQAESLPNATAGGTYLQQIPFSTAYAPVAWQVSGMLPPGVGVSIVHNTVQLSGRVTSRAGQKYDFTITLTDQAVCGAGPTNCSVSQSYSITVN